MKNLFTIKCCIWSLLLLFATHGHAQNQLESRIAAEWGALSDVVEPELFTVSQRSIEEDPLIYSTLKEGILLDLNEGALESLMMQQPEGILLPLPDGQGGSVQLQLMPSDLFSSGFSVSASESPAGYEQGQHFQGLVNNTTGSIATASIFEDDFYGFFATPADGNRVIARIRKGPLTGLYISFATSDALTRPEFACKADELEQEAEEDLELPDGLGNAQKTEAFDRCITTYIELDNTVFVEFGALTASVQYTTSLFNLISTLYINDGVMLRLNGINVWTSPSPYAGTVGSTELADYKSTTTHASDAELKQLWVFEGGGGIAYRPSKVCGESGFSLSSVQGVFNNLPAYSWDVEVCTHEWGHNLTSHHTQWCGWSGGTIDNCWTPEGTCSPGPTPIGGGTIMSYCHLSSVGINFANGFGPQPGAQIRGAVSDADCADECSENSCSGEVKYVDAENTSVMYIIVNTNGRGDLIKVKKPAGSGHNLFAIQNTSSGYASVSGYSYFVGSQRFLSEITNVLFTGEETIVTLKDGKILKVAGTGGSGFNMFAVTETATNFTGVTGYNYYIGDAYFHGYCTDLFYNGDELMMAFSSRKILKVRGTGGSGHNMFAVTETSTAFNPVTGYNYYLGDGYFGSAPYKLLYTGDYTLIGYLDGKILKVVGTGGGGHNLFAISESATSFSGLMGYNHYYGDAYFQGYITTWDYNGQELLMGMSNNKMLKVRGTGGGGHNMFAVTETTSGFNPVTGYPYYIGDARFLSCPIDIERVPETQTFISFSDRKVLKIRGYGGSGHNMFAVVETATSFSSVSGYNYYIGEMYTPKGSPTDVEYIAEHTFTGFDNLTGLKVDQVGGSGHNMHAVIEFPGGFAPVVGYNYYVGDQIFDCSRELRKEAEELTDENETSGMVFTDHVALYPNPTNTQVTVRFDEQVTNANIRVANAFGQVVMVDRIQNAMESQLATGSLPAGVYFVEIVYGSTRTTQRLIVAH